MQLDHDLDDVVECRLTGIETRLTNVETRMTNVESRLTSVEEKIDQLGVGLAALTKAYTRLENAVNREASENSKFRSTVLDLLDPHRTS